MDLFHVWDITKNLLIFAFLSQDKFSYVRLTNPDKNWLTTQNWNSREKRTRKHLIAPQFCVFCSSLTSSLEQLGFHFSAAAHWVSPPELESKHEFVIKVRDLVKCWPRPIFVVMRYLFAFLNHLSGSRYTFDHLNLFTITFLIIILPTTILNITLLPSSDENMMDPYNIAICFGPTLVPIPTDRDQVAQPLKSQP